MPTRSTPHAPFCAAGLVFGSCILTALGGEAGGDQSLPWLATLAALTGVWIASLRLESVSPALLLGTALAIRLIFLIMPAGYDVYRYVWEGRILLEGFNPYLHPPEDPALAGLRDEIWKSIGHPGATAIYPPLTQWLFAAMASVGLGLVGFKVVFVLADVTICLLLKRCHGSRAALIYAWNPLAAVSFAGGGHYDSVFMLAMVLAWLAAEKELPVRAALWAGSAIALKWMALPLGLWLVFHAWRRRGLRSSILAGVLVATPAVLTWILLCQWTGEWTLQLMPQAFSRAARSAELLPAIADAVLGFGPLDNRWYFIVLLAAWCLVAWRSRSFVEAACWGFGATYLLSPMLHAWYFVWALPLTVKSRHSGFIALAASGIFYYVVHVTMEHNGGKWTFGWWERAAIWLPFVIGFLMASRSGSGAIPHTNCVSTRNR